MKNFLLLAMLFLIGSPAIIAQGLLSNGSFENWTSEGPEGWTTIDEGITLSEENILTFQGNASACIEVTTNNQGDTDLRQWVEVVSGINYQISVMIYHTEGNMKARWYCNGKYGAYSDNSLTEDWQSFSMNFAAELTDSIEIGLRFYDQSDFDGSETLYLDNFLFINEDDLSSDATLKDLLVDGTTVSGFDPSVKEYQVLLEPGITGVPYITCIPGNINASVTIGNVRDLFGDETERTLTIEVVSQDGLNVNSYNIIFLVDNTAYKTNHDEMLWIYPNPAKEFIALSGLKKNHPIEIFNISGILITKKYAVNPEMIINVSDWEKGVYILKTSGKIIRFMKR